ncbi:hypothetical protein [Desulfocurvus sp. DL9XJH121]
MQSSRTFIRLFAGLTLILTLAAAGLNIYADPFGVWRPHGEHGITPGENHFEYLFKPYSAVALRPKVVLLGNSRVSWGLPAEFSGYRRGEVYNLGVTGATLQEIHAYLDYSLRTFAPEKIIIGLSYEMFTDAENGFREMFPHDMLDRGNGPLLFVDKIFDAALSSTVLKHSLIQLSGNKDDKYEYGLRQWKTGERTAFDAEDRHENQVGLRAMYSNTHATLFKGERLNEVDTMERKCRAAGTRMLLFIEPRNVFAWISYERRKMLGSFMEWKRALTRISPVYDFTALNQTTLAFRPQDFYELSHFTPAYGKRLLRRMDGTDNGFGDLLTADNVDGMLKTQQTAYAAYRTSAHYRVFREYNPEAFERLMDGEVPNTDPSPQAGN